MLLQHATDNPPSPAYGSECLASGDAPESRSNISLPLPGHRSNMRCASISCPGTRSTWCLDLLDFVGAGGIAVPPAVLQPLHHGAPLRCFPERRKRERIARPPLSACLNPSSLPYTRTCKLNSFLSLTVPLRLTRFMYRVQLNKMRSEHLMSSNSWTVDSKIVRICWPAGLALQVLYRMLASTTGGTNMLVLDR